MTALYRWEFERSDGEIRVIDAPGALTVNDPDFAIRAAEDGIGLAYCLESQVADRLADGRLQMVLADWCVPSARFEVYYPSRRQLPQGLRALIEMMKALGQETSEAPIDRRLIALRPEASLCGFDSIGAASCCPPGDVGPVQPPAVAT